MTADIAKTPFLIFTSLLVAFLLQRLIFSRREIKLIWPLLLFVCILGLIYKLNSNNRVYSYHGFMHAGIVYEILNKEIPPSNPLMAGKALPTGSYSLTPNPISHRRKQIVSGFSPSACGTTSGTRRTNSGCAPSNLQAARSTTIQASDRHPCTSPGPPLSRAVLTP